MNYYNEIETYIKKNEVNKRTRVLEENYDTLNNYWNIGRLLVEAQGGSKRAKYGNALIKEWSIKYTEKYGSGYNYTNLSRFRQFYIQFPILATVWQELSWSHFRELLPIKDENKRNYYLNLSIKRNLSVYNLRKEIKNNAYERLANKSEKIELIASVKKNTIFEDMKNPILFQIEKNVSIENENDLEVWILSHLKVLFTQLGSGFTFVENQYRVKMESNIGIIDLLLFNYKLNCFGVVELKLRELRKEDKTQIEFYMQAIDEQLKEPHHNKTIGIIITKEQDKFIANFVSSESIIPLTYKIENK